MNNLQSDSLVASPVPVVTSPRRTLVTGASRAPGLDIVKQCLERGDRVIAASRNPARVPVLADWRAKYGTLELVALDPADAVSVAEAIPVLESISTSLDLLVITPGEPGASEHNGDGRHHEFSSISAIDLVEHYRRHAVAPLMLVRTLWSLLENGDKTRVVFVDDDARSPGTKDEADPANYAEPASKAALKSLVPILAAELSQKGVTVLSGTLADV